MAASHNDARASARGTPLDGLASLLAVGSHRLTCPACGRSPRDRTFGVTIRHGGGGVGHCHRCGYVSCFQPDRSWAYLRGKAINHPVLPLKRQSLSHEGIQLFSRCTGLQGTVGEQYLLARGCVVPPADGDLRFHACLKHPASDHSGPALVALVTHAETRAPLTLHRTWIRADGRKADIDPARMLLGGHAKKHGVIRLWPDDAVAVGLAIAEGVETALTLAHDYKPVWSLIDAGNLADMPVLRGIETLVIGADHDDAGIKAATAAADRWARAGTDVRVIAPQTARGDWNDQRAAT